MSGGRILSIPIYTSVLIYTRHDDGRGAAQYTPDFIRCRVRAPIVVEDGAPAATEGKNCRVFCLLLDGRVRDFTV